YNGPQQTVVAGPDDAVRRACQAATDAGLHWNRLAVSHAFHSPLMAPAAEAFASWLARQEFGPLSRRLVSTVTGGPLEASADIPALLRRQITDPVRFASAVNVAAGQADLFVEVGPGRVLTRMVREISRVPAVALDTDDESLTSLFTVLAAVFVLGGPPPGPALSAERLARPLELDDEASFFTSPCEAGPSVEIPPGAAFVEAAPVADPVAAGGEPRPAEDALVLLRRLVAERAELPPEVLRDDSRLLDELHLSSITVGQIVSHAARELGLPAVAAPANFATATVRELADALSELARGAGGAQTETDGAVNGVASWVRPFVIDLVPAPPTVRSNGGANGRWQVYAPPGHPLAEPLRRSLEHAGVQGGVLICLPERCPPEQLEQALAGVQAAARQPAGNRLVLVQPPGPGAAGLVKSARLEFPTLPTTIVHTPLVPAAVDRVVDEVAATDGFLEVSYDGDGERRVPVLRPLPERAADLSSLPLKAGDVLLVIGGGKGITAESALALAAESGARLAILGRSDPEADPELASNLARMEQVAPKVRYLRTDITDRAAVQDAVRQIRKELGPITAVLHGAGRNEPSGLLELDPAELWRTFAPKVDGLRAVLAAVEADDLRLLITFGSIIGRGGLRGEAHYALANEWLAELTRDVLRTHPHCRAVCLEWSVWSGVGMGERLSVVESLLRTGVTPVTVDEGISALRRVLADPGLPPVVMVTGRTGELETLRYHRPELPLLRFLERPLVHYHGVELVT
ncbi:MAG TPA: SDR family NAD(P)-dependent oxidoreductase, partial [Micromonosporaceae bacterium]|nr:SDR family NAD(P)-dependent oxidoreductase [Micromonosporaceae bacterium]